MRTFFTSRRWLPYSLRSPFVLTTVVAACSAWSGYRYREAQRAGTVIREMGGCAAI